MYFCPVSRVINLLWLCSGNNYSLSSTSFSVCCDMFIRYMITLSKRLHVYFSSRWSRVMSDTASDSKDWKRS